MTEAELSRALKAKRERERLPLREAARQIGLSAQSVLWRIENGRRFDYPTGQKILNWLQPQGANMGTVAAVNAAIFADTVLSADQAKLISELFANMYQFAIAAKKKNNGSHTSST